MRFIPTKFHAPLDYIVGVALIAAPWIFQFSEHTAATIVPIVLGIGLIAYSLFTNYELGLWKVAPMAVHHLIDIAAGALLAAPPASTSGSSPSSTSRTTARSVTRRSASSRTSPSRTTRSSKPSSTRKAS